MAVALPEKLFGVGALIVSSDSFITILELHTSRTTNKIKGMDSLPMETAEKGEDDEAALKRLFKEEVQVEEFSVRTKLCDCELTPGVVLHAYLAEAKTPIRSGSFREEVANPKWIPFQAVLEAPKDSLKFRPGVYEVVSCYMDFKDQPEKFSPRRFNHTELRHKIPQHLFDL